MPLPPPHPGVDQPGGVFQTGAVQVGGETPPQVGGLCPHASPSHTGENVGVYVVGKYVGIYV